MKRQIRSSFESKWRLVISIGFLFSLVCVSILLLSRSKGALTPADVPACLVSRSESEFIEWTTLGNTIFWRSIDGKPMVTDRMHGMWVKTTVGTAKVMVPSTASPPYILLYTGNAAFPLILTPRDDSTTRYVLHILDDNKWNWILDKDPNGSYIYAVCGDNNSNKGYVLSSSNNLLKAENNIVRLSGKLDDAVASAYCRPDGKVFAVRRNHGLELFDCDGKLVESVRLPSNAGRRVGWSSMRRQFYCYDANATLYYQDGTYRNQLSDVVLSDFGRVMTIQDGELIGSVRGPFGAVQSVAFSEISGR